MSCVSVAYSLACNLFSASLSPQLTSLQLQCVSPKLLSCRDLEIAVPGSYDAKTPIVRIRKVTPLLNVITSKQQPRKLSIYGSNGAEFMLLLKGHEDLRQDEHVMQLLGLVKTLLANDPKTFKRHLRGVSKCAFCFCSPCRVLLHICSCHVVKGVLNRHRGNRGLLLRLPREEEDSSQHQASPDGQSKSTILDDALPVLYHLLCGAFLDSLERFLRPYWLSELLFPHCLLWAVKVVELLSVFITNYTSHLPSDSSEMCDALNLRCATDTAAVAYILAQVFTLCQFVCVS